MPCAEFSLRVEARLRSPTRNALAKGGCPLEPPQRCAAARLASFPFALPSMPTVTPAAKLRKATRRKVNNALYPERRKVSLNCSLTRAEDAELQQRARRLKMSRTTCLKELAFAYSDGRYLVPPNVEAKLETVIALLRNVATNINQMAARANRNRQANYSDYLTLKKEVLTLEDRIKHAVRNPKLADTQPPP